MIEAMNGATSAPDHLLRVAETIVALNDDERDLLSRLIGGKLKKSPAPTFSADQVQYARVGARTLTPREKEIVLLVMRAKSNKEIARLLDISPRTVEVYRARAMQKLGARNVVELCGIAAAVDLRDNSPQ